MTTTTIRKETNKIMENVGMKPADKDYDWMFDIIALAIKARINTPGSGLHGFVGGD